MLRTHYSLSRDSGYICCILVRNTIFVLIFHISSLQAELRLSKLQEYKKQKLVWQYCLVSS